MKNKGDNQKKRYVDAPKFVEGYQNLYNRSPLDRNMHWSPRVSCTSCYGEVSLGVKHRFLESAMEWSAPKDHPNDCFFCKTVIPFGATKRRADLIEYAEVPSVKRAKLVLHEEEEAVNMDNEEEEEEEAFNMDNEDIDNPDYLEDDDEINYIVESEDDDNLGASSSMPVQPDVQNEPSDETMMVEEGGEFNIAASTSSHVGQSGATSNVRWSRISQVSAASATSATSVSSGEQFRVPRHFSNLQPHKTKETIVLNQARLNDYIRDLNLTKTQAELHASHLCDLGLGDGK